MPTNNYNSAKILLVEDDPGDQKLIKLSFKNQRIANQLYIVNDGNEALEYLNNCNDSDSGRCNPDLILLDLNMPGMNGKEFLKNIKNDDRLKIIPVVVLTTSDSEKDIQDSYNLQASGYVKKPLDIDEYNHIIKEIGEYWFMLCKRPRPSL